MHGLLSLGQTVVPVEVHLPVWQASPEVQALPSLQLDPLAALTWVHPSLTSHASVVHGKLSSQLGAAPPLQTPLAQASLVVHAEPSLQVVPSLTAALVHPLAASHPSVVHALPSSQLATPLGLHTPAVQTSPVVQASLSVHALVLLVLVHPSLASHPSLVHGLLSSQLGALPPLQTPATQASPVVHALASSQGTLAAAWVQPLALSQASAVHGLLSSQLGGLPPTHAPPAQTSGVVHALLSVQLAVLLALVHPSLGSQPSLVHGLLSSQLGGTPPLHTPPVQASLVVHALPSWHAAVVLANTQPSLASQLSAVQTLPSSQVSVGPDLQAPPLQASLVVHALPSLQLAVV